jgi:hypothetical protein
VLILLLHYHHSIASASVANPRSGPWRRSPGFRPIASYLTVQLPHFLRSPVRLSRYDRRFEANYA